MGKQKISNFFKEISTNFDVVSHKNDFKSLLKFPKIFSFPKISKIPHLPSRRPRNMKQIFNTLQQRKSQKEEDETPQNWFPYSPRKLKFILCCGKMFIINQHVEETVITHVENKER